MWCRWFWSIIEKRMYANWSSSQLHLHLRVWTISIRILFLNDRASWRAYILALIVLLYPGYHVRQSSQNVSYPNFWEMLLIAAYSEIDKIPSVVYMRFVEGGLLRRFILNLKSEDRTFSWLHVWGYMHKGRNNSKRGWEVRWKKE